jgi:hypothetical protein
VCRFLDIYQSSKWLKAIPQGGPLLRGQTNLNERRPVNVAKREPWSGMPPSGARHLFPTAGCLNECLAPEPSSIVGIALGQVAQVL